jgi:hypothetical protein
MKQFFLLGFVLLLVACGKKEETIFPTEGPITESIYASGIVKTFFFKRPSDEYAVTLPVLT